MPKSDLGSRANPYSDQGEASRGRRPRHRFYTTPQGTVEPLPAAQWSKNMKGGATRPVNAYMRLKNEAYARGDAAFEYNGKTYTRKLTKTGLVYYGA